MFKTIVLLGKAGSGKDTLAKEVNRHPDFHLVVPATTRPRRDYEVNGIDYHFVDIPFFHDNEMIDVTDFNHWLYGIPLNSFKKDFYNIVVTNPDSYFILLDQPQIDIVKTFKLEAKDKVRLTRQLNREIDPDVKEIVRRFSADDELFRLFDGFAKRFKLDVITLYNNHHMDVPANCNRIWEELDKPLN